MKFKSIYTIAGLLLLMSTQSFAFVITVTEKQLNAMLIASFPIIQSYQGIDVRFLEPKVQLNASAKKVTISTTILAMQSGKLLHASGTIEGVVAYKPSTQELQFEKPTLIDFKVIDNQLENSSEAIEMVRQNIGKNLPIILLVDFKKFDMGFGEIVPKDIKITSQGLAITL